MGWVDILVIGSYHNIILPKQDKKTALILSLEGGHLEIASKLISANCDLDLKDMVRRTWRRRRRNENLCICYDLDFIIFDAIPLLYISPLVT